MKKRIIYTNSDGELTVIIPSPNWQGTTLELAYKDVPKGASFEIVDAESLPTDRTFRNAWEKDGSVVKTDMPKAKEIAHTKRRLARDEHMAPLDIKSTIPKESVKAESDRAALRVTYDEIQRKINKSTTEAELKSHMAKPEMQLK